MKIPFKIDHIDPLGQGVSKKNSEIVFIPKTLPGEEGLTRIIKKSKGVKFGIIEKPDDITITSPDRNPSPCPHFDQCSSCHFLHTSYPHEIQFKHHSLNRLLGSINLKNFPIKIIQASARGGYRNRIQLHYDLDRKKIGFINSFLNKIVEVPQCLLPIPPIREMLKKLYLEGKWILEARKWKGKKGHVEFYMPSQGDGQIRQSWNDQYAQGGFSQINAEMNQALRREIFRLNRTLPEKKLILDLFGGNGNLTHLLENDRVWVVDTKVHFKDLLAHQNGLECDMYGESVFPLLGEKIPDRVDMLILDPPRSGLKNLARFVDRFSPSSLFYISCNPHTLVRDLQTIQNSHRVAEIILLDFFPSTYHFETLVYLTQSDNNI